MKVKTSLRFGFAFLFTALLATVALAQTYTFTTLAGVARSHGPDNGTGTNARFYNAWGVAVDSAGTVYVADTYNHTIRTIDSTGYVSTFAGKAETPGNTNGGISSALFNQPNDVAVDAAGNVYVADSGNNMIRKITTEGVVSKLAGTGVQGGSDSPAQFNYPQGIAVDGAGNVYVADTYNHTIRKIDQLGNVSTLAGLAGSFGNTDNTTGTNARFKYPYDVAVDAAGTVYVADGNNRAIRTIATNGFVMTLAPFVTPHWPSGVTVDRALPPVLYVSDCGGNAILKITSGGVVTTLAGSGAYGSADGTGSDASFDDPAGLAVDGAGTIYVADFNSSTIRVGVPAIADVATIDAASGPTGIARQLDTAPQTATSWRWSIDVAPAGSVAQLSSTSVRNPTFTPDVAGVYTFRLLASGPGGASISTVSLDSTNATLPPTITAINPASGPDTGGQSVTISGTNLSGASVTIGGISATVTGTTATTATFTTPAHAAGAVDVTLTTGGGSATSVGGYTYDSCSFFLSPVDATASGVGGTGSFTVTTGASCARSAVSLAYWIRVTGGTSGTGSGTVTYSVEANTTAKRIGSIFVGGQLKFRITQNAQVGSGGGRVGATINAIFTSGSTPDTSDDANGDCAVTPIDVFWVINAAFADGPPIETCPTPQ